MTRNFPFKLLNNKKTKAFIKKINLKSFLMKTFLLFFVLALCFVSCNKSENNPVAPANNTLQITSFSPASGLPGDVITLTGTNFDTDKTKNTVKFGDKVALINSATATELKVVVPGDAVTSKITVAVGSNTATSASDFTVNKPQVLSLTGFSPASGLPFDTITLTGTLFDTDKTKNTVKFGNSTATVISATATELKVLVPDGGKISVKVGTQTVTSDNNFTRLSIYVSGWETAASGIRFAVYWKDGDEVPLTDAVTDAFATGIAVSGGNVFVAGKEDNTSEKGIAKYWKNSIPVPLTDGKYNAIVSGITIEGNNVYTVGSERNDKGDNVAKYWKNNTPVILTDKPGYNSASAISVVGSNIYTAVYNDGYPAYFENTTPQILSTSFSGSANAISVRNNDIYTAGDLANYATYWKNKTSVSLTDKSESYSSADAIFLYGNDVYTAGQFRKIAGGTYLAVCWKNNKQIALTDGSKSAAATGIAVSNNNVYVVGNEGNKAKLWKNGKLLFDLTDGFSTARATGIYIAPY
jgi:hypothetical protein